MGMTADEQLVYDAVEEIQGIKKDSMQSPDFATLTEVYNFLRPELPSGFEATVLQTLRTLCRKCKITYRMTVNGIPMFGIKRSHEDTSK